MIRTGAPRRTPNLLSAALSSIIDSMATRLTESHSVATPVDWKSGDDVVIVPSLKDPEVLKQKFPEGWRELKPYLRPTPQPDR